MSRKSPYYSYSKIGINMIWTLSDNEAHIERQFVFQLETLCNYALNVVFELEFGKRFQSLLELLKAKLRQFYIMSMEKMIRGLTYFDQFI